MERVACHYSSIWCHSNWCLYLHKANQNIKHNQVSNQVYNAAFRGLYRLDYTGKVLIDEVEADVEIRSSDTFDDFLRETVTVEWIFVIYQDRAEMYEAVYSGIWRSYHFVDKNKKYRWVYGLKKVE